MPMSSAGRSDMELLQVAKLSLVALSIRTSSILVENGLDLARINQVVDFVAGLAPIALPASASLDVVWRFAKVPVMRKVFWVRLSFVDCPFVSSGHVELLLC